MAGTPTYEQAVRRLERALQFGVHPSLDGIVALTDALGRPQDSFSAIQVAGTNGKSSVTRMTAAVLKAHGVCAAVYTSPHLESYTERMEIDGVAVAKRTFASALSAALRAAEETGGGPYTEFELLTAAALWLFRKKRVQWAVLEVGMGGRWDATSVVEPRVAVVTGIALDHVERLGTTRRQIAEEKAQVIKRGSVAVLGTGLSGVLDVFLQRAEGLEVPVSRPEPHVRCRPSRPGGQTVIDVTGLHAAYRDLVLTAPSYQAPNVACALAAAQAALGEPLDEGATRAALAAMTFPGRFEVVREDPIVVLDGAHNPDAAEMLGRAIEEAWPAQKPDAVLGILKDKDAEGIVGALAPHVRHFVASQPEGARALGAAKLARIVRETTGMPCEHEPNLSDALALAVRTPGTAGVVVTGSLYTAGQARSLLRSRR